MKIKEIFDFSSEISCTVNLVSLEEILFNELKKINLDSNSMNCLRLNEFKELSFDGFLSEKKFLPERNFIMKYISKLIKSTYRTTHPSFYIYNKNYTGKEDDDIKTINQNETAHLIIVPNSFMEETNNANSRKISLEDPINIDKKESLENQDPEDAGDEEHEEIRNLSLENQDFKSRMGRSFLEKSKIIYEFQKHNADSNEKEQKDFASCSSLEKTVLFIKSNQDEEQNLFHTQNFFKKPLGPMKKVQSENLITENIDSKLASESQQDFNDENENIKKSFNNSNHKKFSSIFNRMRTTSKYSNLSSEFRTYLKAKCLLEVIESYSNIKMCKNALEHVGIPHSRDLNIISEDINAITRIQSISPNKEDEPISVNNKRILTFISVLSLIFIGAILFIFLSN